jgi:hypothetical protein
MENGSLETKPEKEWFPNYLFFIWGQPHFMINYIGYSYRKAYPVLKIFLHIVPFLASFGWEKSHIYLLTKFSPFRMNSSIFGMLSIAWLVTKFRS